MRGKAVIRATIDDAVPYVYSREQADAIIAGYPQHERDARAKGIPILGSGRIYPLADDDIAWETKELPEHFVWIGGMDLGGSGEDGHPTAAVKCAWDRDTDTFYVTQAYRRKGQTPLIHSGALRAWGDWLPWSWPHDALKHDVKSGEKIATIYKNYGLNMLPERATFSDGSNGVEAGIMEILEAMQTGRFKVAKHLEDWWDEFRLYHRKDGKIVKEYDDLMDATRYAWMMRRYAAPEGGHKYREDEFVYAQEGGWMA